MSTLDLAGVRGWLADPDHDGSLADRARTRRRRRLLATFPDLTEMSVLDLGGTGRFWRHLRLRPGHLTMLNVVDAPLVGARMIVGDATRPPAKALDRHYDLVLCNSVIDQVGGRVARQRLASVIREAGNSFWVQSANRDFPIDAYFLFPYFSRLPVTARVAVLRRWRLTHLHTTSAAEARERVLSRELQSRRDLQNLFPDAELLTERFCCLAKSLIAVRA